MKSIKWILCAVFVAMLAGCVTGDGSTENSELAAEAATMGQADLEAMIAKYTGMISEKTELLDSLKAQLKEIPVANMMGEKATALKSELSETSALIKELKSKLAVYTDALKALKK